MLHARRLRLVAILLLCLLGVSSLPASPVAAQNCANIGPGAFLAGCDLSGLDLSGYDLSGANLRGANLEETNLDGANLSGANLSNATLTEGALDTANTAGANLRGIAWVPAGPRLTMTYNVYDPSPNINRFAFAGTGFLPNGTVNVTRWADDNRIQIEDWPTDAGGSFTSGEQAWNCLPPAGTMMTFTVTDGVNTASLEAPIVCS
jgi:hypothetical protein